MTAEPIYPEPPLTTVNEPIVPPAETVAVTAAATGFQFCITNA